MYSPKFKVWKPQKIVKLKPGQPSKFFEFFIGILGMPYLNFAKKLRRIKFDKIQEILTLYKSLEESNERLIFAFRHPGDTDPQSLYCGITIKLRRIYKKAGLANPPRVLFVAAAEIPLWGGPLISWVLEKAGIVPLSHGAMSRESMKIILSNISDSKTPLALAPEGQVSYWSKESPEIDDGIGQIMMWAEESSAKNDKPFTVSCVPIGIDYTYPKMTYTDLHKFTQKIENLLNLGEAEWDVFDETSNQEYFAARFRTIFRAVIEHLVQFYEGMGYKKIDSPFFHEQLQDIADFALSRSENYYGIEAHGNLRNRVMHLRKISLAHSFRPESELKKTNYLRTKLLEREAAEAFYQHRNQELADLAFYLHDDLIIKPQALHGQIEAAQNLMDLVMRSIGGSFGTRLPYFKKEVIIRIGEKIALPKKDESGRKERLAAFRSMLKSSFDKLLEK